MARAAVENPFKERRVVWVNYVLVSVSCLIVLWIVRSVLQAPTPRKEGLHIRWTEPREQNYESAGSTDDEEEEVEPEEVEILDEEQEMKDNTNEDEMTDFPELTIEEYPAWLHRQYMSLEFQIHNDFEPKLNKQILEQSLSMGCDNMVANMRPEGNFNYQYDFVKKVMDDDDMAVRQVGALWGLSMCWQHQPDNHMWQVSVEKGIDFYANHMAQASNGLKYLAYPGSPDSEAGSNALLGLTLIEYLRTVRDANVSVSATRIQSAQDLLSSVIRFLKFLQMDDQHFSVGYRIDEERKREYSSPYYDGEAMLCLIKAAKYVDGYRDLIPMIEEAAPVMAKAYTFDAWRDNHDSDDTKGFYQWSSMVFTEYYDAEFRNYEVFGDYVIVLGHWIIYTHGILERQKNTGYAYEGIISAYTIAKDRGYKQALDDFVYTIDNGLYELSQWQIGGPLAQENPFLVKNPTQEKIAVGGVMNGRTDPSIRIDTTQHQMHSLIMASLLVYN